MSSLGASLPQAEVEAQAIPFGPETPEEQEAPIGLQVVTAAQFAAVEEEGAEPLIGVRGATVLPAGGDFVEFGDGGAGKTTLEIDAGVHLATGTDWLGLPVPRPVRVLIIENEGPRGMLREKLAAKLAAWQGPPPGDRLLILESPWAEFTFADERARDALCAVVEEREIEVIAAGPVARLGMQGGGTQDQIAAFMDMVKAVRQKLSPRLLAVWLTHHENKAGDISGAWEGFPDTLLHIRGRGHGATGLYWQKVRWSSPLQGQTWKLLWTPGEGFELDDAPDFDDETVRESVLRAARENPGAAWRTIQEAADGSTTRRQKARDELLVEGLLVNLGTPTRMELYAADNPTFQEACLDPGTLRAHSRAAQGSEGANSAVCPVPPIRGTGARHGADEPTENRPPEACPDCGSFYCGAPGDERCRMKQEGAS